MPEFTEFEWLQLSINIFPHKSKPTTPKVKDSTHFELPNFVSVILKHNQN